MVLQKHRRKGNVLRFKGRKSAPYSPGYSPKWALPAWLMYLKVLEVGTVSWAMVYAMKSVRNKENESK